MLRLVVTGFAAFVAMLSQPTLAEQTLNATESATPPADLTPYSATYTAKFKGMNLKAVRTLEPLGDNRYRIVSDARHFFFGRITESSEFSVSGGQVRPDNYHMKRKILGSSRREHAQFDWDNSIAQSTYKNKTTELPLAGHELDWLGYQVQLSKDLQAGKKEFHYQIIRRGRSKDYHFKVVGEEVIDTPMGQINTLKLERVHDGKRKTTFWMSPQHHYLLAKFQRVEEDGDEYALFLKDIDIPAH